MNIAMEQTEEYVNGQLKNKYGDCFIRGNNGAGAAAAHERGTWGKVWARVGQGVPGFGRCAGRHTQAAEPPRPPGLPCAAVLYISMVQS